LHSGKSHFDAAASSHRLYMLLGLPVALISGVAGVSAFASFANHSEIAGILALAAGALGAATTFLKPSESEATHHGFGNDYDSLRHRARLCRELEAPGLNDDQLALRVVELSADETTSTRRPHRFREGLLSEHGEESKKVRHATKLISTRVSMVCLADGLAAHRRASRPTGSNR
jgi:hypothetical protein